MKDIDKALNKLLEKWLPKLMKAVKIDFGIGSAITIQNTKIQGKKTTMSPLSLNKKEQKANEEMIESLIKDVNSEVAKKINYLVNKSITNNWDNKMLADELSKIGIEETYKNRFKTIASNESFRLMNNGADKTARQLGYNYKYMFNPMDNKTAEDSKIAEKKYGSPEKAIPIDEPFKYTYKGKVREFMLSPDRVNDRSFTYYLFEKPESD